MSYSTGSATTVVNAMSALSAFAVANAGMTLSISRTEFVPAASVDPLDSYSVICLTKGARHWWFRYRSNKVFGFPCSSNAGSAWESITNRPAEDSQLTPIFEPFTSYHLFTEGTVVHMALEMSNGSWTHINFGDVTQYAAFTGGHYLAVTNCLTDVTFGPEPSGANHFYLFGSPAGADPAGTAGSRIFLPYNSLQYGTIGRPLAAAGVYNNVQAMAQVPGIEDRLVRDQPNAFNGRALAVRMEIYMADVLSSGLWLPMGYIPNIRPINIKDLNPKDIVNTDWMAFPCQSKNAFLADTYANSFNRGWVVRK